MGVLGPILIYEIFIRFNPVASFWFGGKAESPVKKEPEIKEERAVTSSSEYSGRRNQRIINAKTGHLHH